MSLTALLPLIGGVIDKILPDKNAAEQARLRLTELMQQGQLAELEQLSKLALAQTEVNRAEAQSDGWFKGGWRPAIGYVLAACLAYQFLINPLLLWACALWSPTVTPPTIGLDDNLWELMFGMLGLAGWRSLDKRQARTG